MSKNIGKLWAGRVYGTNTGNIFVEFTAVEPRITGTLRFLDSVTGIAVYDIDGTYDGQLQLTGKWRQGGHPDHHGALSVQGSLTPEGTIRGTWDSTIGTGGTFELHPHDAARPSTVHDGERMPSQQIYSRTIPVGTVRLYSQDLRALIQLVREEFQNAQPVVTYCARETNITKYAADFLTEMETLGRLTYLKITITEVGDLGINKVASVEFSQFGNNQIQTQGPRESWVIGKADSISKFLKERQSMIVTQYKKFGLNINSLLFLAMLVVIPEITTLEGRAVFVAGVMLVLAVFYWIHARFIPNAVLTLTHEPPGMLERWWPTILSWFSMATSALAAMYLFHWLTTQGQ